ncbi:MAG: ABC transporter permease [Actinomycetales bacterium]|nr:ABC transporter permease [Actinomycetales bacterium]
MSIGTQPTGRLHVDVRRVGRIGALYVAEYRLRNMWKWKRAVITDGLGNPVLYLASIGLGVGSLVNASLGPQGLGGVPYLLFLAPALMAAAAMQGAMTEAMFPTLAGFLWDKGFFAMRSTALTGGQIADGVLIAAVCRVTFTTAVYWLVLRAFGAVEWASALTLIPVAVFAGACWGALMLAITAHAKNDDAIISIAMRLVIMPMFLFSGTFYPLSTLPISVQWIGWISPLWHATELGRWLSYGMPLPSWQVAVSFCYLVLMGSVGLLVARRRFEQRLTA